jgi:hypothetical protein
MRSHIPAELRERYEAVGFAVSQWALAEIALDIVVAEAFRQWGDDCPESGVPRSLKKKLTFLRRFIGETSMRFSPELLPGVRERLGVLLDDAERLGNDRHWLAHGTTSPNDIKTIDRIDFFKTLHGGSDKRVFKSFTIAEIDDIATRAAALMLNLVIFAYASLQMMSENQFYQMFPEIRRKVAAAFPSHQLPGDDIAEVARDS